jgi:hypothetical protein
MRGREGWGGREEGRAREGVTDLSTDFGNHVQLYANDEFQILLDPNPINKLDLALSMRHSSIHFKIFGSGYLH